MKKINFIVILALSLLVLAVPMTACAEDSVYTVDVSGYYRSPLDNKIEDSGGESQEALGQSMVDGAVNSKGLIEKTSDGDYALYVRFSLMDNISDVSFWTAAEGDESWNATSYSIIGSTNDTSDFYITLPNKNAYVRAECYVDAMGRSVIFYIGYDNLTAGNTTDFNLYSDNSIDTTTESINEGLTIGYSNTKDSTDDSNANVESVEPSQNIIDDSVWLVLFLVVFSAVFLAGLALILVCLMVQRAKRSNDEIRLKNLKKLDRYKYDDIEDDEFSFVEDM